MSRIEDAFSLADQVAVITGGGSGIGRESCLVLADAGARVVVADIDESRAEETAELIRKEGGAALSLRMDTTRRADHATAVDRAVAEFGRLDIYGNIAGVPSDGLIADVPEEELDRVIAINLKGVFFGCQEAVRVMAPRRSGVIINASSTGIDSPAGAMGVYALTKAAVAMMTKTLAFEVGQHGIRVNAIAPGATPTNFMNRRVLDEQGNRDPSRLDAFVEAMKKGSPLGVVCDPTDQALLVLYLASRAGAKATGNIFRVNAGQSMAW